MNILRSTLKAKPDAVLCLATGASPEALYALAAREPSLFAKARIVKLDEWYGLSPDHPATCQYYLQRNFVGPIGISRDRYLAFKSDAADPGRECARITRGLAKWGGIDLAILGIGVNGHLGLNEPADELIPQTHVATLTAQTKTHAMLKDTGAHATKGLTLGLAQLLQSRQVMMLVSGTSKRKAMARLLKGKLTTQLPASMLLLHPQAICICDKAAMPGSR